MGEAGLRRNDVCVVDLPDVLLEPRSVLSEVVPEPRHVCPGRRLPPGRSLCGTVRDGVQVIEERALFAGLADVGQWSAHSLLGRRLVLHSPSRSAAGGLTE